MPFIAIKDGKKHIVKDQYETEGPNAGVNTALEKAKAAGFEIKYPAIHKGSGKSVLVPENRISELGDMFDLPGQYQARKEARPVETGLNEISYKTGVDRDKLENQLNLTGVSKESDSGLSKVMHGLAGVANTVTLGLPSFANKKVEDDKTEKAFDAVNALSNEYKPTGQKVAEGVGALLTPIPGSATLRTGSAAARLGKGIGQGAAAGGVGALTASRSGEELSSALGGAGAGAVISGVLGGAGQAVRGIKKGAGAIKDELATKAVGARKMFQKQIKQRPGGQKQFAKDLLDSGIVKAGDDIKSIASKTSKAVNQYGDELNTILKKSRRPEVKVNPQRVADDLEFAMKESYGSAADQDIMRAMKREIKALRGLHKEPMSITKAQELRRRYDQKIFTEGKRPESRLKEPLLDLRRKLEEHIETAIDEAGEGLGDAYKKAKKNYGFAATANRIAQDKLDAENANRFISLTDMIASAGVGAGLLASDGVGPEDVALGALAGAANRLGRRRGAATAAVFIDKLSKKGAGAAANRLTQALSSSNNSFLATHKLLYNSSDNYRKILDDMSKEETEE